MTAWKDGLTVTLWMWNYDVEMKRLRNISALFAVLTMFSCTDRAYTGVIEGEYDDAADAAPVPVLVGVGDASRSNDVSRSKGTKGSGAMDSEDGHKFSETYMYVYAFNRTKEAPFTSVSSSDAASCLIDATTDGSRSLAGRRAYLDADESFLIWPDASGESYYPAGTDAYDFYAYFTDDYVPSHISRYDDRIVMPVEIDGARDIMSGRAVYDASSVDPALTETEKALIGQRAFSAYCARRGVNPVLHFRHHLARLRFEIYPATDDAYTVYLNSIKVSSRHSGSFTAVARNAEDEGIDFSASSYSMLELCEADGSPLKQMTYHPKQDADFNAAVYERPAVQVGGSLLVAPDSSYEAMIEIFEDKGQGYSGASELHISSASGFLPGQQYVVRIAVYGMMKTEIRVQAEPWGTGGRIILDNEDKYTPAT